MLCMCVKPAYVSIPIVLITQIGVPYIFVIMHIVCIKPDVDLWVVYMNPD